MKPPIFVRSLTAAHRQCLSEALRSPDAFTVRRAEILLASAQGLGFARIARYWACAKGTVLNALRAFAREDLDCLREKSSRPHTARPILDGSFADPLKDLPQHSPGLFGQATSVRTLNGLAEVCHAKGWTPWQLSDQAIRQALRRLDIRWRRAKH